MGLYSDELHAAWRYNVAVFEEYSEEARCNGIEKPEGGVDTRRNTRCLSRGVKPSSRKYTAHIKTNTHLGTFETEQEASTAYKAAWAALVARERSIHVAKEITTNSRGPYVMAGDQKVYVSAGDWHNVSRYAWNIASDTRYPQGAPQEQTLLMHQYLMGTKEGHIVEHKDQDKNNNRGSNLHFATRSFNIHNVPPRSASGKGVSQQVLANSNYSYRAAIGHNNRLYCVELTLLQHWPLAHMTMLLGSFMESMLPSMVSGTKRDLYGIGTRYA